VYIYVKPKLDFVMKRKIYDQLLLWKNKRKGKSAMMIEGARRVGKSYIVKEFAQKEYKSYILIDFFKVGDDIKDLFKNYKDNLDMLFTYLSTYFSTRLYPGESIIVFDEIEFCPAARAAIKYLVEDGRYDYLETGSLLGMKMSTKKNDGFRRVPLGNGRRIPDGFRPDEIRSPGTRRPVYAPQTHGLLPPIHDHRWYATGHSGIPGQ